MLETLKFGKGNWANKTDSTLAYSDQYGNFQAIPFDFTRATTATRVNKQGLIESVNDGIARIDYSDSTQGALLLEPQITNLITYSNDFSVASWFKEKGGLGSVPLVTSNQGVSPSGVMDADKIVFDLNGGTLSSDLSQLRFSLSPLSGDYSNSVYLKSFDGNSYDITILTATGSIRAATVTNEWKRFSYYNGGGTTSANPFRMRLRGNESTSDSATLLIYGAQLEQSSYSTSLIPTNGAIATRNEEICNNATPEVNSQEGVLYTEISSAVDEFSTQRYFTIRDNSYANRIFLRFDLNTQNITFRYFVNSAITANLTYTIPNATQFNKIACVWKLNSFQLWVNGLKVSEDLSANVMGANLLNSLNFTEINTNNPFFGNTKDLKIYNTALTDAQLQTLTTI